MCLKSLIFGQISFKSYFIFPILTLNLWYIRSNFEMWCQKLVAFCLCNIHSPCQSAWKHTNMIFMHYWGLQTPFILSKYIFNYSLLLKKCLKSLIFQNLGFWIYFTKKKFSDHRKHWKGVFYSIKCSKYIYKKLMLPLHI